MPNKWISLPHKEGILTIDSRASNSKNIDRKTKKVHQLCCTSTWLEKWYDPHYNTSNKKGWMEES